MCKSAVNWLKCGYKFAIFSEKCPMIFGANWPLDFWWMGTNVWYLEAKQLKIWYLKSAILDAISPWFSIFELRFWCKTAKNLISEICTFIDAISLDLPFLSSDLDAKQLKIWYLKSAISLDFPFLSSDLWFRCKIAKNLIS